MLCTIPCRMFHQSRQSLVVCSAFVVQHMFFFIILLNFFLLSSSTSISEDLGQVEYVLTDKTGTLTENRMEFKKCIFGGQVFGGLSVHGSAYNGECVCLDRVVKCFSFLN